ncbi:MAG: hypothetical protein ACI8YQ_003783 [Polaribacter sp.]|jgi:hypothetical protein
MAHLSQKIEDRMERCHIKGGTIRNAFGAIGSFILAIDMIQLFSTCHSERVT